MLKFLTFGDVHASDVNPSCRTDDYSAAVLNKLKFVGETAAQENVDFVLGLGDIFHRKAPNLNSHDLVRSLMETFKAFPCPVYSCIGNHDISMNAEGDRLNKQPIMSLNSSGAIRILNNEGVPVGTQEFLYGLTYSEINEKFNENYSVAGGFGKTKILSIHQTLLDDGDSFFGDYLNFGDLCATDWNVVLCGHYHPGYKGKVIRKHGKVFINPGALTRGSLDSHNLDGGPQIVLVQCEDDYTIKTKVIDVPYVDTAMAFDLEKLEEKKLKKIDLAAFSSAFSGMVSESIAPDSVEGLMELLHTLCTDKSVLSLIRKYIEDKDSLDITT